MPFFSIVIPVYNVEKYIHQCIDSVLNQDLNDFEIILVNDGSSDSSPFICDDYAALDSRIKVIHKKNGGLSDARNMGILASSGDYLMFLDSDDYWEGTIHLDRLKRVIVEHNNIDTVLFRCKHYFEKDKIFDDRNSRPPTTNSLRDVNLKLLKMLHLGTQSSSACLRVVKRSLIVDNKIFFTKDIVGEDSDWFVHLSLFVKSCYEYPKTFYIYRQSREGSLTFRLNKKSFEDQLFIIDKWHDHLSSGSYNFTLTKALNGFLSYLYCVLVLQLSKLPERDYKHFFVELEKRRYLLKYSINIKSKIVYSIDKLLGLKTTVGLVNFFYYLLDKYRKS